MKKLSWFLIIVLLLGCFAGCQQARGPIENADGTLSDWMKREIESYDRDATWAEDNPWGGYYYYGTENGYVFLFRYGMSSMAWTTVIGEYRFNCPMEFHLLAYKDKQFYKIKDLYNDGILTDACIGEIYRSHCLKGNQTL